MRIVSFKNSRLNFFEYTNIYASQILAYHISTTFYKSLQIRYLHMRKLNILFENKNQGVIYRASPSIHIGLFPPQCQGACVTCFFDSELP